MYYAKNIQIFVVNMTFISSNEVKKCSLYFMRGEYDTLYIVFVCLFVVFSFTSLREATNEIYIFSLNALGNAHCI